MEERKLIRLVKPEIPEWKEIEEFYNDIRNTGMISNFSKYCKILEEEIKNIIGCKYAIAVSSCDIGLILSLSAIKEKRAKVILPSFTFVSTANSVIWNNLEPIFCDIDPNTLTICPIEVEKIVKNNNPDDLIIFGVHVFGNPCDVSSIDKISKKYNIPVIYDSAHAFGSSYNNKMCGNFGDAEVFSFSCTKVITFGEGGVITTNREDVYNKLLYMRNYGFSGSYNAKYIGINAKLSEINAITGILNLKKYKEKVNRRIEIVNLYKKYLSGMDIGFQYIKKYNVCSYKDFTIIAEDKNNLIKYLSDNNIETRSYFYPIHKMESFKKYNDLYLKNTEDISNRTISLPVHNFITNDDVYEVCDKIKDFSKNRR